MCYSAKISLFSYLAVITGSIGLYKTNLIPESLFFTWIGHMQLYNVNLIPESINCIWLTHPQNIDSGIKLTLYNWNDPASPII